MSDTLTNGYRNPTESGVTAESAAKTVSTRLRRRYAAERRFRAYGLAAIGVALFGLAILFVTIVANGYTAFHQTHVRLDITVDSALIDPAGKGSPDVLSRADYAGLVKRAMRDLFPEVKKRRDKRRLYKLISQGAAFDLRRRVLDDPGLIGRKITLWVPASADVDMLIKGHVSRDAAESGRRLSDTEIAWIDRLTGQGRIETLFNTRFFTGGDSREPELAGIWSAVVGSFLTMIVTLAVAFPLAVAAAVYLEEFAPRNLWTQIVEVNINNLAAVPSIVFGLLGLAVFLNFFGMPRSAPAAGGVVLAIMTLPTIIIAGRAALTGVPPSIREAAFGMGASPVQVVAHHVLPLAMPGILTGTIIGMARALGETAPLLMVGMVAFIVDTPTSFTDPATVLPVQVYLWADSPERAFVERTSAAIMVLLGFLVFMNALAVLLRHKFERRW